MTVRIFGVEAEVCDRCGHLKFVKSGEHVNAYVTTKWCESQNA